MRYHQARAIRQRSIFIRNCKIGSLVLLVVAAGIVGMTA